MKSILHSIFIVALLTSCAPAEQINGNITENINEKIDEQKVAHNNALLIHGGSIITQSSATSLVEAMLIQDGRITAVGSFDDLLALEPKSEQLDLAGKTIIPGIIDSHVHVRELGTDDVKANLVGTKTTEEMVERLKTKFPAPKPNTWLLGQGWDEGEFASRGYPDRQALDTAFPNNPVVLESLHGFANFANGRALELAGVDATTPNPEVGQILKRSNGEPTGVMLTLAQKLITEKVPPFSHLQIKQAIKAGLNTMARAGVTSVHEAGMTPEDVTAFTELAEQNELPIRVYGLLDGNNLSLMNQWFSAGIMERDDLMFAIRSIKVFYDGSLGSRTAMLKEPYSDHPEKAHPTERITPEAVASLAKQAAEKGFQMAVHAIGDEGNERTLNIYEQAINFYPERDHRWRIEHAQVVLPDYFMRAAKANIISSMQSSHAVGDSKWAEDRVGSDRIQYAYAWQKILSANGKLIINSDLPGEPWMPMQTLYFAVNRTQLDGTPKGGWYPEQALSVEEALHAMTLEGAYSAFQEQDLGSLELGKLADFVVLDKNPLTIKTEDLASIRVMDTYVAGNKILN